jgi:hypothetical protein
MNLKIASELVLDDLKVVVDQIRTEDYNLNILSLNASISQHIRHILEFYVCLFKGIQTGIINYDNRERDKRIESDRQFTSGLINQLKEKVNSIDRNSELSLEVKYGDISEKDIRLQTNLYRELAYNIEHTIHHLAIIKPSLSKEFSYIELPDHFGIASSTIRFTNQKYN